MEELEKVKNILKKNPDYSKEDLYIITGYCINELGINLNISSSGKLFDIINNLYKN